MTAEGGAVPPSGALPHPSGLRGTEGDFHGCDLEVRVDIGVDADVLTFALEERDPVAEGGRRRPRESV
jgi:hypothetical protein